MAARPFPLADPYVVIGRFKAMIRDSISRASPSISDSAHLSQRSTHTTSAHNDSSGFVANLNPVESQ
eukprot:scaffold162627_cov15-Prasinocladus_malaysianus.AAC.1